MVFIRRKSSKKLKVANDMSISDFFTKTDKKQPTTVEENVVKFPRSIKELVEIATLLFDTQKADDLVELKNESFGNIAVLIELYNYLTDLYADAFSKNKKNQTSHPTKLDLNSLRNILSTENESAQFTSFIRYLFEILFKNEKSFEVK